MVIRVESWLETQSNCHTPSYIEGDSSPIHLKTSLSCSAKPTLHWPFSTKRFMWSRKSLWAMKAASAFSWGHVACAFSIVGFDTFFSHHQCENFYPEAASALSWGHVHCAFTIVGFDIFFLNHRCKNFHAERPQLSHHNPPNRQFGRRNFQIQARSQQCTKTQIHEPRPVFFPNAM